MTPKESIYQNAPSDSRGVNNESKQDFTMNASVTREEKNQRRNQPNQLHGYVLSFVVYSYYIYVTQGSGCSSNVGRIGGKQEIWLAGSCASSTRVIQHEFMHALGLSHEQPRPDRDSAKDLWLVEIIDVAMETLEVQLVKTVQEIGTILVCILDVLSLLAEIDSTSIDLCFQNSIMTSIW